MGSDKSILKSKTFYFGALSILIGIANIFGFGDYQPTSGVNEFIEIINGVLIIGLRVVTKEPVRI